MYLSKIHLFGGLFARLERFVINETTGPLHTGVWIAKAFNKQK